MTCKHCNGTGKVLDHASIGSEMRSLRMKRGLSCRSVSKGMGISAPYLSDLELGRRNWSSKLIDLYKFTVTHHP